MCEGREKKNEWKEDINTDGDFSESTLIIQEELSVFMNLSANGKRENEGKDITIDHTFLIISDKI